MARIRTIKPEFFTSLQVADVSPTSRLLFVGMLVFADDRGVHPWSAKLLKMEVFAGDDLPLSAVQGHMDDLERVGLIRRFRAADGDEYFVVTGWHHQRIEKPRYRYPDPADAVSWHGVADESPTNRRLIDDELPLLPDTTGEDTTGEDTGCVVADVSPTLLTFPCDGDPRTWVLRQDYADELQESYPKLDVVSQCRQALAWIKADSNRNKTAKGMRRFIVNWLNKATNDARAGPATQPAKPQQPNRLSPEELEARAAAWRS